MLVGSFLVIVLGYSQEAVNFHPTVVARSYLQLDPQNLKRYCTSFQTTPLGTQRNLQIFDDTFKDNDWDACMSCSMSRPLTTLP